MDSEGAINYSGGASTILAILETKQARINTLESAMHLLDRELEMAKEELSRFGSSTAYIGSGTHFVQGPQLQVRSPFLYYYLGVPWGPSAGRSEALQERIQDLVNCKLQSCTQVTVTDVEASPCDSYKPVTLCEREYMKHPTFVTVTWEGT